MEDTQEVRVGLEVNKKTAEAAVVFDDYELVLDRKGLKEFIVLCVGAYEELRKTERRIKYQRRKAVKEAEKICSTR